VRYVLARLPIRGAGYRVNVTRIRDSPVDTFVGEVKLAATVAVCAALGVQLDPAPRIESVIHVTGVDVCGCPGTFRDAVTDSCVGPGVLHRGCVIDV
jgi:hypothetical protein